MRRGMKERESLGVGDTAPSRDLVTRAHSRPVPTPPLQRPATKKAKKKKLSSRKV
jgi:hypothetical protein